jgi:glycosyltransferase involved in cell wall biosynthesis
MPQLTVIIEQCLSPVPGGTGRYAREITGALADGAPPGWSVRSVVGWHRDRTPAVIAGVAGPQRLPAGRRMLSQLWLRGLPPWVGGDRVQATTPLAPGRKSGMIVTVHDAVPWTHPETLTPHGVSWHRVMVGRAMERAEAIVVPSQAVADDLAGLFPARAGRLRVIGHGVTTLPVPGDAELRRRRLALPPGGYVLSIATLEPRKGLDVLMQAMALPAAGTAHLAVIGPVGWGGVDIASAAAAAGVSPDRVHALGRLDDAELAAVLAGATAVAVPSRSEGFGLPALEAMAAGVPVIVSDAPALVELVAGAGVVVPREDPQALASAIGDLFADPRAVAELAAAGKGRAADFRWPKAASQLWDLHLGTGGGD